MRQSSLHFFRSWCIPFFLAVVLLACFTNLATAGKPKLVETPYADPKGFFRIHAPAGWQMQEYPDDPRGKVKFLYPGLKVNMILVIAQATALTDREALRRDLEGQNERMKARIANVTFTITETTFDGTPALRVTMEIPNTLKQSQLHFLLGGTYYALCYGSTPERFEEFRPEAMACLDSIEPIAKNLSREEAARHTAASKVRTARLMLQLGQKDYARVIIREGLALDPGNPELQKLQKEAGM